MTTAMPARTATNPASLGVTKQTDDLAARLKALIRMEDQGALLIARSLAGLFAYASNRVPEISDTIYSIDDALKAGFAWDLGPFEYWDALGLEEGLRHAEKFGEQVQDARLVGSDDFDDIGQHRILRLLRRGATEHDAHALFAFDAWNRGFELGHGVP